MIICQLGSCQEKRGKHNDIIFSLLFDRSLDIFSKNTDKLWEKHKNRNKETKLFVFQKLLLI
jgi:hypothetical protein